MPYVTQSSCLSVLWDPCHVYMHFCRPAEIIQQRKIENDGDERLERWQASVPLVSGRQTSSLPGFRWISGTGRSPSESHYLASPRWQTEPGPKQQGRHSKHTHSDLDSYRMVREVRTRLSPRGWRTKSAVSKEQLVLLQKPVFNRWSASSYCSRLGLTSLQKCIFLKVQRVLDRLLHCKMMAVLTIRL